MRKKLSVMVFLAILVIQSIVAFSGTLASSTQAKPAASFESSQDAGTRLGPGEHTNHVPFVINSTADFAVQGWPGSGTELDPYVIAGLNITTASADQCIRISFTDAYFVIRDCYIKMELPNMGIFLMNAAHGRIEYTTIFSESMGIHAIFSDNLVIAHTLAESVSMTIFLIVCHYATVEWSYVNCSVGFGIYLAEGNYFTSAHNYAYSGLSGGMGLYMVNSNHSSSSFDTIEAPFTGAIGFYAGSCYYLSVSDLVSSAGIFGILAADCPSSNFTRCDVSHSDTYGAYFANCPNLRFTDSTVFDVGIFGVLVADSNNSVISDNIIEDAGTMGMQILGCNESKIVNNTIMNTPTGYGMYITESHDMILDSNKVHHALAAGVYMEDSERPTISNIEVIDSGDSGIVLDNSPNGTLTNCAVTDAFPYGIYFDTCHNFLIADNTVTGTDETSIFVEFSLNVSIYRNQLTDCGSEGIDISFSDDARIENNTISGVEGTGLRCYYADRALISRNAFTQAEGGIFLHYSDNVTVTLNTVTDAWDWAIDVYLSDRAAVTNNTLVSAHEYGIYVNNAVECVFDYNTMTECGFYFVVGYAMNRYNHSMIGNVVNDKPVYYAYDDHHVGLVADSYGQIILLNSTFAEIAYGTFQRATTAVQLLYCDEAIIRNLECYDNYKTFMIYSSDNVTVRDLNMEGREGDFGIYSSYSDRLLIQNCTFNRFAGTNSYGIMFQGADYATVTNCSFNYNWWGIRWSSTDNVTVSDCTILNSEQYGIYAWGSASQYALISGNTILNATRGFYSSNTERGLITDNLIMYCSDAGIYLGGTSGDEYNVTLNVFENNRDGVTAWTSDEHFIMNNTMRWNSRYGAYVFGSDGTQVFYNTFALNGVANGYDSRASNFWDDGVALGNWWHDYEPPGIYNVDGSGGNTDDRYPMQYLPTAPIINQPQDVIYEEFSTGNEITWLPFDDSLRNWAVSIDGEFWAGDAWNFVDIAISIDDLAYGTHIVVVTVWDIHDNNVTDIVIVEVIDGTDPVIHGPPDTQAFVDGSSQTLTWEVYDLHPGEYELLIDDVVTESGTWAPGTITTSIDGLTEGVHLLHLNIYDLDGNSDQDEVLVEVIDDDTAPTIDNPNDLTYVEGTMGNSIVWTPVDMYPASYQISHNGSMFASGDWGGSRVIADVDGLPAGSHFIRLTVYDGSGLSAYDEVTVTVTAVEVVTLPPVDDSTMLLLIGAVVGAAIIVVVIVLLMRKKQAA